MSSESEEVAVIYTDGDRVRRVRGVSLKENNETVILYRLDGTVLHFSKKIVQRIEERGRGRP